MNLVVAKSIFKRYEMVVDSASSGYEAVEFCRGKGFDIIFMDHMMGGMDGVEAMKKIRSDVKGVNHETPMIALTANAMSSAKQMFLSEGFDGFVSKPIEIEELERTIRRVLPKNLISYVEEDTAEKRILLKYRKPLQKRIPRKHWNSDLLRKFPQRTAVQMILQR